MWSSIGRATARQVRVAGVLSLRRAGRLAAQPAISRIAPTLPCGIRVAAVFTRGFAEAGRPKKTASKAKEPAARKAKKPLATKRPAAKSTAKAKTGPKKEVLTEEQKVKRKAALRIKKLKETGLLKEQPSRLPFNAWMVFTVREIKNAPGATVGPLMKKLGEQFRALSADELEKLEATARQNRADNVVALRNWISSRTVREIREANLARQQLARLGSRKIRPLHDPRFPKGPGTAFSAYVHAHYGAGAVGSTDSGARFKELAAEWNGLSDEERKPYQDIAAAEQARFQREFSAYQKEAGLA